MRRVTRAVVSATVAVGVLSAVAWGQPPGGEPPQKRKTAGAEKKAESPGAPGPDGIGLRVSGGVLPGGPPPKVDPQVEAWVKTLTDKMNDPHDAIRDSARAGLIAIGPPALPALRRLADGNDAKAYTATRLVQQIERAAAVPGVGGFGVYPGQPGVFSPQPAPPDGRRPGIGVPDGAPRPGNPDEPARPGAGREAGVNSFGRTFRELKLTDEQTAKAEQVVAKYVTRTQELFEGIRSGKLDRAEAPDSATKLAQEAMTEIRRSLTPEQLRRFDELVPIARPVFPFWIQPGETTRPGRRDQPPAPDQPRPLRPNPPEMR